MSAWKSKGVYASKLFPLDNLSPTIKYPDLKKRVQLNDSILVVKKNNYVAIIVNVYNAYDLYN